MRHGVATSQSVNLSKAPSSRQSCRYTKLQHPNYKCSWQSNSTSSTACSRRLTQKRKSWRKYREKKGLDAWGIISTSSTGQWHWLSQMSSSWGSTRTRWDHWRMVMSCTNSATTDMLSINTFLTTSSKCRSVPEARNSSRRIRKSYRRRSSHTPSSSTSRIRLKGGHRPWLGQWWHR